ncbi:MAG: DNA-3-methyladenine glycosylase [Ferruginibacter sp.]
MQKLPISFYERKNVLQVAMELLGKIVCTQFNGIRTSGRIVETEAYVAFTDRASHSYNGRRTARNEHMYAGGGTVYVYICYGMHQMLNIVTNKPEIPDAVLIRAIEPVEGIDRMLERTGKPMADLTLTKGPGNLAKALGIYKHHSGYFLTGDEILLYKDAKSTVKSEAVGTSRRIGVETAGKDALLPYRFYIKGNKFVSGSPVK